MTALRALAWATVASFLVAIGGTIALSVLAGANLATGASIPWAAPVIALFLWLYWRWLGGEWWPHGTSAARREHLRARRVSARTLTGAFVAGVLGIVSLGGIWIACVELFGVGGNPTVPDLSAYPPLTIAAFFVTGSLVAPVTEEAAFRGYAQTRLESAFPAVVAVALSSALFALYHGPTQGFIAWKLLFFFLVGALFGSIAYRTRSTLPALPVHFVGDLIFFTLVWPNDAARPFVPRDGLDASLALAGAQAIIFGIATIVALRMISSRTT